MDSNATAGGRDLSASAAREGDPLATVRLTVALLAGALVGLYRAQRVSPGGLSRVTVFAQSLISVASFIVLSVIVAAEYAECGLDGPSSTSPATCESATWWLSVVCPLTATPVVYALDVPGCWQD